MSNKAEIKEFYNKTAHKRKKWIKRNRFYHKYHEKYFSFVIPEGSKVLEIGCSTGKLLNAVKPNYGVGIDISDKVIDIAKAQFPELHFYVEDAEYLKLNEKFEYIILSDIVNISWDIQKLLHNIHKVSNDRTRVIISFYNYFWQPFLKIGELFRIKQKQPVQNWITQADMFNLLHVEGFETIKTDRKLLLPKYIPLINFIFNKVLGNLPFFNLFCLNTYIIAKPQVIKKEEKSVSILVPARNEKGNIENAILRTPKFGSKQQWIFVEGNSSDGTYDEMLRVQQKYSGMDIMVIKQSGKGKGNAVREGFEKATCDILMILDADLTAPPEDMPKFYHALVEGRGEFINGCRLVYTMEKQAMRFLNFLGNKFFGWFFSYLLGQRLKDTLCGTKVLYKEDYLKIKANRSYFGDFDPFGDFDLLFGAAKLNLKIVEINVRYKDRTYGSTQISRFKHGWLLIKMSLFAAFKIKFK